MTLCAYWSPKPWANTTFHHYYLHSFSSDLPWALGIIALLCPDLKSSHTAYIYTSVLQYGTCTLCTGDKMRERGMQKMHYVQLLQHTACSIFLGHRPVHCRANRQSYVSLFTWGTVHQAWVPPTVLYSIIITTVTVQSPLSWGFFGSVLAH